MISIPFEVGWVRRATHKKDGKHIEPTVDDFWPDRVNLKGADVCIVDGVMRTGATLQKIRELIEGKRPKPRKVYTCVLLMKKIDSATSPPDLAAYSIEDRRVVGYGIGLDTTLNQYHPLVQYVNE